MQAHVADMNKNSCMAQLRCYLISGRSQSTWCFWCDRATYCSLPWQRRSTEDAFGRRCNPLDYLWSGVLPNPRSGLRRSNKVNW